MSTSTPSLSLRATAKTSCRCARSAALGCLICAVPADWILALLDRGRPSASHFLRRKPIVVVAVQDGRRVGVDAGARHQRLELLGRGNVSVHGVDQIRMPADVRRTRDMAAFVQARVHAHLHHPHLRIVQVLFQPLGRDQVLGMLRRRRKGDESGQRGKSADQQLAWGHRILLNSATGRALTVRWNRRHATLLDIADPKPPPMPLPPSSALLDDILRAVPRRYRVPETLAEVATMLHGGSSTALAVTVEQARLALAAGTTPDAATKQGFIQALARLIHEATRTEGGDPAFQAIVLRHGAPQVREFAHLSTTADQDRRQIHAAVNGIAHPAKLQRMAPSQDRDALAALQAAAASASWTALSEAAQRLRAMQEKTVEPAVQRALARLLDDPALARLQRLDALAPDGQVRQYQSLWDRHGPRSGSQTAAAQGCAAQRRGAAVEALATEALAALSQRLNEAEGGPLPYRVVTSMLVPASIPASAERAKSEWDAVLLRQTRTDAATPRICRACSGACACLRTPTTTPSIRSRPGKA
ncbi:hypothetical protein G6F35_008855 [Rhizopus arrhizus]|nr:hypothetical protein G6F35_008855 [Rhizopus arrhizus]